MAIIKVRNPAIDLDAAEIPNIPADKITSGTMDAARIGSGTFADARIASSNVSQHVTAFDDNKLVNDISTLALRQASNENKAAYNTNSMYVDVFQDSTGITNLTNASRNASEYISATSSSTSTITLNSSNYTTYFDTSDDDMFSIRKYTSGATTDQNRYDTTQANNANFSSSSDYQADQTVANSHEATLLSYMFGTPSSGAAYLIQNSDTSATFRLIHHNMKFKDGVTFKPNGTSSFRWRNGSGSFGYFEINGINTSTWAETQMWQYNSSVSNGSSYSNSVSNSTFFSQINVKIYHTGDNGYMFDSLSIAGDVTSPSVSATGSFESNAITAPSSTSSMGAIITYQDNAGTNALNTDIVLKLSADGGSNYATATLVAMPDFASGIKMAKVNDLSVTAGTSLKYKIEFANQASGSKEARIRGVSLQY